MQVFLSALWLSLCKRNVEKWKLKYMYCRFLEILDVLRCDFGNKRIVLHDFLNWANSSFFSFKLVSLSPCRTYCFRVWEKIKSISLFEAAISAFVCWKISLVICFGLLLHFILWSVTTYISHTLSISLTIPNQIAH